MAALFPLNTGPISNNVAHICPLNTKWWENSVQVENSNKFLFNKCYNTSGMETFLIEAGLLLPEYSFWSDPGEYLSKTILETKVLTIKTNIKI